MLVPLLAEVGSWEFIWQSLPLLLAGLWITIKLTIASLFLGFVVGFPAGIVEVYGDTYSRATVQNAGVVLRGTPILVIIVFTYFVLEVSPAFLAALLALGFRSAAYQSQIFRGAFQSVSGGQMEAARAVGLNKRQAIQHVIVPQALRRSIPGFQNEMTIVLKDTSIAFAIGLAELLTVTQDLFVQKTTAIFELILFASLLYFVLTFTTNRGLERLQTAFAIPGGESQ
jgi:polar amino acid transport system permease protein